MSDVLAMDHQDLPEAALILAGGRGTRLAPITDAVPKPLLEINGKPTIEWIVEEIAKNGIENIYFSLGYRAEQIKEHLEGLDTDLNFRYIIEKEPLGTGGAIKLSLATIMKEPSKGIFITYGDELFRIDIADMFKLHKNEQSMLTMAVKTVEDVSKSGVVTIKGNRIVEFIEKPDPKEVKSRTINIGKYIINTDLYHTLPDGPFLFERDFLHTNIAKLNAVPYLFNGPLYATDTTELLKHARMGWKN
jgi:NDP-sugar pyrophosphorylase family protein